MGQLLAELTSCYLVTRKMCRIILARAAPLCPGLELDRVACYWESLVGSIKPPPSGPQPGSCWELGSVPQLSQLPKAMARCCQAMTGHAWTRLQLTGCPAFLAATVAQEAAN